MHIRKSVSTVFIAEKDAIPATDLVIVPAASEPSDPPMRNSVQDSLRDYVLRVMRESNLTALDVHKNSKRRGGDIARSTVQMIVQGKTPNPGIITLRDLALGLMRPLDEVITNALGQTAVENSGFLKSELANVWEVLKDLPLGEQRMFKRYVQMLEREARRVLSRD